MPAIKDSVPSLFESPAAPPPAPSSAPKDRVVVSQSTDPNPLWGAMLAPLKIILILLRLPFEILRAFHWVPMVAAIYFIWAYGYSVIERLWAEHVGLAPTLMSALLCVALTLAATQITSALKAILDVLTGRDVGHRQRRTKKIEVKVERLETSRSKPLTKADAQKKAPQTPAEVFATLRASGLDGLADNAEAIVKLVKGFADKNHPLRADLDDGLRTILGRALAIVNIEPRPERRSPHLKVALEECDQELRSLRDACEQVFLRALPSNTVGSINDVLQRIQAEQRVLDEVGARLE